MKRASDRRSQEPKFHSHSGDGLFSLTDGTAAETTRHGNSDRNAGRTVTHVGHVAWNDAGQ